MKLLELHLRVYGVFSDYRLDLSGGREGLHVIFGRNEAGKSSALRALRAWLYGIPERTQDDFLFPKTDLRVGGRLRSAAGEEFVCYRRKGRKQTLLGPDDKPVPEETLQRLLGGVDERLFERLFGIDHESLVSGGQALLVEHGREAEALFSTGLGSTAVHGVLERLDQEAQSLFAPRASKPLINAQLGQFAYIERRLREVSLSARQWEEARRALSAAEQTLTATDRQLADAVTRRGRLERIRRTLPDLAKRRQVLEHMRALGEGPRVADDFSQRRADAVSKRILAVEGRLKALSRLESLKRKAESLDVSDALLAEADTIDDLREKLGSYRKAAGDRPDLEARRTVLMAQAAQRLAEIRPDLALTEIDRLRPLLGKRRRAADLGARREALESVANKTQLESIEAGCRLDARREELSALPEPVASDGLRQRLDAARRLGDIDGAVAEAEIRLVRHRQVCERELGALGLWRRDLRQLRAAPLPEPATLNRFVDAFLVVEGEQKRHERACTEVEEERRRTEESLRELQLSGAVPTEEQLARARERRQRGWRLLQRQWVDGEDVTADAQDYAPDRSLPAAFEQALSDADEVADRLWREADRVHHHATMQAKLESFDRRFEEAAVEGAGLTEERRVLEQSWQRLWADCDLIPLPPREMVGWLEKAARLREKLQQGDELEERFDSLCQTRNTHSAALLGALEAIGRAVPPELTAGGPLAPVLEHAEVRLASVEALARQRSALEQDLSELEETTRRLALEAETARTELERWQAEWTSLIRELAFDAPASPGEVSDYLETVLEGLRLVDEAEVLRGRLDGIDSDSRRFEGECEKLVRRLAPDLRGRPVVEAVPAIHSRLAEQRGARSRLRELESQIQQAGEEVAEAEAIIRGADEVLAELCRQAGCDSPAELEAAEARFREKLQLERELRALDARLLEGGDGLGIDGLQAETGGVELESVKAELLAVERLIEQELKPRRETEFERRVNAERDFESMTGSDEACSLAEEAEQVLSGIRDLSGRFVRARLAARILREEIDRFRRHHRDPILGRASGYFEKLTCRSFAGVETDFDDADQTVLVGVRSGGRHLRVEAMSTGTRDQLYLALRLAALQHYLAGSEPLPFIVDDILVQFDDERSNATLGVLAEFSRSTQVILFTHHRRVVEQAGKLGGADGSVFVHELG